MKRKGNHKKDWNLHILLRRSPGSILLHNVSVIHFLLTGSILLPVLLCFPCCDGMPQEEELRPEEVRSLEEYRITAKMDCTGFHYAIKDLKFYVYDAEGFRELIASSDMTIPVMLSEGEYDIVGIANSQGEIDESVIRRFEVMELLTCSLDAEDHSSPMCSGQLHLSVRQDTTVSMRLTPMISRVKLVKVENCMEGTARVEEPYVYLTGLNSQAEILRQSGFRPTEFLKFGQTHCIDDIGKYPSYPDVSLYCYPNESTGLQATGIVMECIINGRRCRMESTLPEIGRNVTIYANLTIFSADDYRWSFNE